MPDRFLARLAIAAIASSLVVGCATDAPESVTGRTQRFDGATELPAPDLSGEMSLEQALVERRSLREFGPA